MRKDEIIKGICEALVTAGAISDYAYDHFRRGEVAPLPYAVYRRVAPGSFSADDRTYHVGENVDLEIYASDPDEMAALMVSVEAKLDEAELFYNITADTVYIDSENFYESLYEL